MNIAITATEPSLDAKIDPRFGRCPYFLIVDADTLNFEAIENPSVTLGSGSGIQSAQLMAERDVKYVLTGNCGPNAYQTLSAAGISVIIGCSGMIILDVIEQFKAGQLNAADQSNVASKSGLTGAPNPAADQQAGLQQPPTIGGMGMGRGMGGGMGRGRGGGRGMGGGMGRGQGMRQRGVGSVKGPVAMPQQPTQPMNMDDELDILKQQAEAITQQMQQIQYRIHELEQEKRNG